MTHAIFFVLMFYHCMFRVNQLNFNFRGLIKSQNQRVNFASSPIQTSNQNTPKLKEPLKKDTLSIYYYNDTHGNSDQMAQILSSAKEFKKDNQDKNTFILSAGDNCSGGDYKKNEFIFDLMQNYMGVELSAIGNHEADAKGSGFYEAAKDKNINFIATNVEFDNDNPMKELAHKSVIKEKDGVKYGFIGTMPIDFKACTKEDVQKGINVMDFDKSVSALQNEISNLKSQGVDRIIMLSHTGYDSDKKFASALDGVDIIVGGHTHNVVEGNVEGENIVKSKSGEPVIITQAGENGQYYGILNVEFDEKGVVKDVQNNLHKTTNRTKSPIIEYIKDQMLGVSPHVGTIEYAQPIPPNRRIEPCGWTELMADSIKNEMGVDIALINSANLRKVPKAGNLTERDVQESSPMKNNLLKTKITQKQLVDAIARTAHDTMTSPDGYPGLIQASGITYKIDDTGELLAMNFIDKNGKSTPVDIKNPSESITYSASYDDFVAKADGETPELAPKFEIEQFDFDKNKTMCDYIKKLPDKENLNVKADGRLEIIQTSKPKQKDNNTRKI